MTKYKDIKSVFDDIVKEAEIINQKYKKCNRCFNADMNEIIEDMKEAERLLKLIIRDIPYKSILGGLYTDVEVNNLSDEIYKYIENENKKIIEQNPFSHGFSGKELDIFIKFISDEHQIDTLMSDITTEKQIEILFNNLSNFISNENEKLINEVLEDVNPLLIHDCSHYLLAKDLKEHLLPKLSNKFKKELLTIINKWRIYNFNTYQHFFLVYTIVNNNLKLKNMYEDNVPYKEYKYKEKLQRALNKEFQLHEESPQKFLILFRNRADELLSNFDFFHTVTKKREKERKKNLLLNYLTDLIVFDNYAKGCDYKKKMRASDNRDEFIETHNKIQDLQAKTGKTYIRIFQK